MLSGVVLAQGGDLTSGGMIQTTGAAPLGRLYDRLGLAESQVTDIAA